MRAFLMSACAACVFLAAGPTAFSQQPASAAPATSAAPAQAPSAARPPALPCVGAEAIVYFERRSP
jgi:hypothetical protein